MKKLLILLLAALGLSETGAGETNLLFYTAPRTPLPGETVTITFTPAPGVKVIGVTFLVEVAGRTLSTPIRFEPRTNTLDRIQEQAPLLKKTPKPGQLERQPIKFGRDVELSFHSTDRLFRSEAPGPLVVLRKRF